MSQDVLSSGWDSSTHDADRQPKNKVLCSLYVHGPPLAGDLGTKSYGLQQPLRAEDKGKPTSDALNKEPSARMERACICSSLALVTWSPRVLQSSTVGTLLSTACHQ